MSVDNPFTGQSVETARRILSTQLQANENPSPDLDARLLIGAVLDLDHTGLVISASRVLTSKEAQIVEAYAQRRKAGEPVARILGEKEFWGLTFRLSAATLVPRPDTETVVEAALEWLRASGNMAHSIRIADIGTGSGAILLALLSELPQAIGIGTDISGEALTTAALNAQTLGFAKRTTFVRCDYAAALSGAFNLIVSNPPYIRSDEIGGLETEVRDHDPHQALDGGPDGLMAYRVIARQAARLLVPGGALIVEVGHDQDAATGNIMTGAGFILSSPAKADLAGISRVVTGQKTAF